MSTQAQGDGRADDAALARHFERLHAADADPWDVRRRWYERRKRALLLAALPREHYATAFEPGCSVGGVTAALAARCGVLWASDRSAAALARAREQVGHLPQVRLHEAAFPDWWPGQPCDLVVVAELAYYLAAPAYAAFWRLLPGHLNPGAHLVLCHWRPPIGDALRTGDAVHADAAGVARLAHVGGWRDEDMRIDVWQHGGRTSVAAADTARGGEMDPP